MKKLNKNNVYNIIARNLERTLEVYENNEELERIYEEYIISAPALYCPVEEAIESLGLTEEQKQFINAFEETVGMHPITYFITYYPMFIKEELKEFIFSLPRLDTENIVLDLVCELTEETLADYFELTDNELYITAPGEEYVYVCPSHLMNRVNETELKQHTIDMQQVILFEKVNN